MKSKDNANTSKYSINKIKLDDPNNIHTKIFNQVKKSSIVLDCGCSSGYLGKALIQSKNCKLYGIEINYNDAITARQIYKKVWIDNLNTFDFNKIKKKFDVILLADVIEHLLDPKAFLKNVQSVLNKKGYIIASLPNIAHLSARLKLINGNFDYEKLGIFDNTHLHFYTQKTAVQLFKETNLCITYLEGSITYIPKETIEKFLLSAGLISKDLSKIVNPDSLIYQFVIKAKPDYKESKKTKTDPKRKLIINPFNEISGIDNQIKRYEDELKKKQDKLKEEIEQRDKLIIEQQQKLKQIYDSKAWQILKSLHNRVAETKHQSKAVLGKILPKPLKESIKSIMLRRKISQSKNTNYVIYKSKNMEKLIFPTAKYPVFSIIIPVYNQWKHTYSCLKSILDNTDGYSYEIIIADDVSTDMTKNWSKYVENIIVIRNSKNLGFLKNCNNAAKHAKGQFLVFLNNDTNVQKDWLKHLYAPMINDTIGIIGSKLVYPDGRLQEAGSIIWQDGSGWNYGKSSDPEMAEFNYLKEVDFVSGACLMIKKELWNLIGGFDQRFCPAYYEDVDLAFEARQRGYKVIYQPKSVIVHFEGISCGIDENKGIKSYQTKNKSKFYDKWKHILKIEHFKPAKDIFLARDRSKSKKTILFIDHYVPEYDTDTGSRLVYHYLKFFAEMGYNVKFLGQNFLNKEPYTSQLEKQGIEVLYGLYYQDNWKKWVNKNSKYIDYVYIFRPHIALEYIDYFRANTNAKIFYNNIDLKFLREERQYKIEKKKEILESANYWKKIELELIRKADISYCVSDAEIKILKKIDKKLRVKKTPLFIINDFQNKLDNNFQNNRDLFFIGGFMHEPNVNGVKWFIKEIFPIIKKKIPKIKFYVIGSHPPAEIRKYQSKDIIVSGHISDYELKELHKQIRLQVVPLKYGAGIKGKIIESMLYGVPIITTTMGAEGIHSKGLVIADTAKKFAKKVIELYNYEKKLQEIININFQYVKKTYSKETAIKVLKEDFELN